MTSREKHFPCRHPRRLFKPPYRSIGTFLSRWHCGFVVGSSRLVHNTEQSPCCHNHILRRVIWRFFLKHWSLEDSVLRRCLQCTLHMVRNPHWIWEWYDMRKLPGSAIYDDTPFFVTTKTQPSRQKFPVPLLHSVNVHIYLMYMLKSYCLY